MTRTNIDLSPLHCPVGRRPLGLQLPASLRGGGGGLPLSGRVGVHHAGGVHPGAHRQRLLLHVGRGPAGQVVLDAEHLRPQRRRRGNANRHERKV